MTNLPVRMMSVLLLGAFVLNISNYLFIRVYNPPQQSGNYYYPKTASGMEVRRSPVNGEYWATGVPGQCDGGEKASSVSSPRNNYTEKDLGTYSAYYMIFEKTRVTEKVIENCPEVPPGLGPELEDQALIVKNLQTFDAQLINDIKPGGKYSPTACKSLQSVAILIAYRGCKSYLSTFMNLIHPFLIKQQLDYQIFVVEQSNKSQPYNRGKLLNVGFTEAQRSRKNGFHCIILHEPQIVPKDSRNLYRCSWYPRQLATSVERPAKASYVPLLGGAIAMTPEQFLKVNGLSNAYWGNDADYFDLYHRINSTNYFIQNSLPLIGKYRTIRKGLALWYRSEYLSTPSPLYLLDGLTSLSYHVDSFKLRRLYTYLQVNIDTITETKSKAKMYDKLLNPVTKITEQTK